LVGAVFVSAHVAATEIHRRSFISSPSAAGGAMRQPMQKSMNSDTPILRLPDFLLATHRWLGRLRIDSRRANFAGKSG
jgi:hypothetical protein